MTRRTSNIRISLDNAVGEPRLGLNLNINLAHLVNFIQIVEWGNISKAASVLNIAQPALSRQVKALEDTYGVSLLRRNARGVEPTAAGKLLLDHARRIHKECELAKDRMQSDQENPSGAVYFGIPSAYALSLVPPLLQRMHASYPNIKLHVVEAFSGTIYEWLITKRLDFAILYYSQEYQVADMTPFIAEDMVAIGAPHVFGPGSEIGLRELSNEKIILPWRPHINRLIVESKFAAHDLEFEPSIEIDSMPCMKELARLDEGITILPRSTVANELRSGHLSVATINPRIELRTVLGQAPGRSPTRAVRILIDELRYLAAELTPKTGWDVHFNEAEATV